MEAGSCPKTHCVNYDRSSSGHKFCESCCRIGRDGYDLMCLTENADEAVYNLGDDRFLEVHTCDEGYDYTLYKDILTLADGGVLDNPELSIDAAAREVLKRHGLECCPLIRVNEGPFKEDAASLEDINLSIVLNKLDHLEVGWRWSVQACFNGTGRTVWMEVLSLKDIASANKAFGTLSESCSDIHWRVRENPIH